MAQVWIFIISGMIAMAASANNKTHPWGTPAKGVITKPKPGNMEVKNSRPAGVSLDINKSCLNKSINDGINNSLDSGSHPEVLTWPRVFVLNSDPSYPVVCYSGVSINITNTKSNESSLSSNQEPTRTNQSDSNERPPRLFLLSLDPLFPVLCREGHIPANLTDDGTMTEEDISGDVRNVTCIRRDYEQNISAIFLHNTGPIQTAWNVFNSSISYGFFNVNNVENIGYIKIIHEAIVNCEDYDFIIDDKGISTGAAASLVG